MESPLDIIFNQWTFLLAPFVAAICSFWLLRHKPLLINLFASFLFFLSALAFFTGGGLTYFLRDGLGPDSVTSTGFKAISRFMESFPVFAASAIFLLAAGIVVCKIDFKSTQSTNNGDGAKL